MWDNHNSGYHGWGELNVYNFDLAKDEVRRMLDARDYVINDNNNIDDDDILVNHFDRPLKRSASEKARRNLYNKLKNIKFKQLNKDIDFDFKCES